MGNVVRIGLPAHQVADPVDDPGFIPASALAAAGDALAALGAIRVLGNVAGPWETTPVGDTVDLVDHRDGHLTVRWCGEGSAPVVAPGDLVEVTGQWTLVDQHVVLEVDELVIHTGPDDT